MSDPWRIAQVALSDPGLTLAGVTVLVDAADFARHAADPLLADTLDRQLRAGDLLVINHTDRADGAALSALRAHLSETVPRTPCLETERAQVPLAAMGLAADPDGAHDAASAVDGDRPLPGLPPAGLRAVSSTTSFIAHDQLFDTCRIDLPGTLQASALRALLKAMPAGTMRLKGLVRTDEHGTAVLQFAGTHGSLRRAAQAAGPIGTVVAIGLRGRLPADALRASLLATCMSD